MRVQMTNQNVQKIFSLDSAIPYKACNKGYTYSTFMALFSYFLKELLTIMNEYITDNFIKSNVHNQQKSRSLTICLLYILSPKDSLETNHHFSVLPRHSRKLTRQHSLQCFYMQCEEFKINLERVKGVLLNHGC